jgi:hypothetical protein
MASNLRSLRIRGVHTVQPTIEEFRQTLEIQWGEGLAGERLQQAQDNVRQHYEGLFLIEVQLDPPEATIEWGQFTQQIAGKPRSEWQVAYDERAINAAVGTWAFFLHFVDFSKPLETPTGPIQLPPPSSRPAYLSGCRYWVP